MLVSVRLLLAVGCRLMLFLLGAELAAGKNPAVNLYTLKFYSMQPMRQLDVLD